MKMSMNIGPKTCVLALSLAGALTMNGPLTQARAQETHFSELANLPFAEGRPTAETTQKVHDELLFQRATQTYLWAMPLINTLPAQSDVDRDRFTGPVTPDASFTKNGGTSPKNADANAGYVGGSQKA